MVFQRLHLLYLGFQGLEFRVSLGDGLLDRCFQPTGLGGLFLLPQVPEIATATGGAQRDEERESRQPATTLGDWGGPGGSRGGGGGFGLAGRTRRREPERLWFCRCPIFCLSCRVTELNWRKIRRQAKQYGGDGVVAGFLGDQEAAATVFRGGLSGTGADHDQRRVA